jgi:hypothetical protein
MRLIIDFQYQDMNGNTLTDDLASQLQLTGRSDNRSLTYAIPATDLVNGKARATIPQGDLIDMNGYQLKLMGTYKQEPTLLAVGNLSLTQAAGFDAMPEDVIDNVPISMAYNFDASIYIRLWQDVGKGTPYDLSATTISATVYQTSALALVLASFTVTPTFVPGEVLLTLPVAVVNTLPAGCWWNLKASTASGVTTLAEGIVTITGIKPS